MSVQSQILQIEINNLTYSHMQNLTIKVALINHYTSSFHNKNILILNKITLSLKLSIFTRPQRFDIKARILSLTCSKYSSGVSMWNYVHMKYLLGKVWVAHQSLMSSAESKKCIIYHLFKKVYKILQSFPNQFCFL